MGSAGRTVRRFAAGAVLAFAVPVGAPPAHGATPARVTLSGGSPARVEMCGATRSARETAVGGQLVARARRGKRALRVPLVAERCAAGRWVDARVLGRRAATFRAAADGDYRVRLRGVRRARKAYVHAGVGEIVDVPFSAIVTNTNNSTAACVPPPDGKTYPIKGHLTGPRAGLTRFEPGVALYLHGLSYAEFFWRFRAVPGYDTSMELAKAGHVSVTVDRLGYGDSTGPPGTATCFGSQATIAKQLVDALKAGTYTLAGETPVNFARVALVGHSIGALTAETTAYSFPGIDALAMLSYADQGASPMAFQALGAANLKCVGGGEDAKPGGPPGYAYFGETEQDFRAAHLNAPTDPAVADAAAAMRTRDPCGDFTSILPTFTADQIGSGVVGGPVLVMLGDQDALFPPPAGDFQAARMFGAKVTHIEIKGAGHGITLGRQAPAFRQALSKWLTDNAF
jgi:pimeloyl-ACP methyl ester carboxylesterase